MSNDDCIPTIDSFAIETIPIQVESMAILESILCWKRLFPPAVLLSILNFILMSISSVTYITYPIKINIIFLSVSTILAFFFFVISVWIYFKYECIEEITIPGENIEISQIV